MTYITYNAHQLRIPRIEEPEILNVIAQLKNSAAGHDSLLGSIMKQCADKYIVPLTHIINVSITKGYFPEEFKLAKVLPIFKSGDDQNIQNYRPISILPFFSKIFEKIIASHIMDFLDTNNILYDKQFGFRKSHSTSHAIITLVDKVSRALDTGKFIVGVFLDLKKAFDTVDHTILLKKLHAYGIRDNHLDWFKSYLNNRTQYVTYNHTRSDIKTITHGVPQGSILAPLLFILYVNDFSRASSLLFSILFADDTGVFIEGECYTVIINILNKELNSICIWLKSNKLTLNVKKSHYMIYHKTRMKKITRDVIIENENINEVKSFKFLGVIIDNKFTWQDHIYYIKNKITKSMGIIYKIRKYVVWQTLIDLYYSLVFPYLIYCNEVWGHANNIYTDSLVKLQKKIIPSFYIIMLIQNLSFDS